MPGGASGRGFAEEGWGTRHRPARLPVKISRSAAAPEKKVTCWAPAPARSARSKKARAPSASAGSAIPLFSQICAKEKGPRFSKKRGSAIRYFFGPGGGAFRLILKLGSF